MNTFRTLVEPVKGNLSISHTTPVLLLGSCFVENIGNELQGLKFNIDLNPFGVLFNPASICRSIERLIEAEKFAEDELFFYDENWHSFMHHSRFSCADKKKCLQQINKRLMYSAEFLRKTHTLILTFGTAWVFNHVLTNQPVSNCHKLPSSNFNRRLLESASIVNDYENLFSSLKKLNKKLNIILTISPVRHLKDGAEENQLSKAILLVAVHELCRKGLATYFPAYEIVLDDLRDYRFYDTDMVHPSPQAIEYIFEKFSISWLSEEARKLNVQIMEIKKAAEHRPVNPDSNAFKSFTKNYLKKIITLEKQHPYLDFSNEKQYFGKITGK
jgi:hypothetical protein